MTQNTAGDGSALEYMLNLNPYTFKVDTVKIPLSETIGVVPNSWYAWTADVSAPVPKKIRFTGTDNRKKAVGSRGIKSVGMILTRNNSSS